MSDQFVDDTEHVLARWRAEQDGAGELRRPPAGTRALRSWSALTGSSGLFLTGCSSAPSRNILGSYFPSWMICALIGMGATVVVRALLAKTGIDAALPMPIIVYLALATAFSLAIWLLWLA